MLPRRISVLNKEIVAEYERRTAVALSRHAGQDHILEVASQDENFSICM